MNFEQTRKPQDETVCEICGKPPTVSILDYIRIFF